MIDTKIILASSSIAFAWLAQVIPNETVIEQIGKLGSWGVSIFVLCVLLWQAVNDRKAAEKRVDAAHESNRETYKRVFERIEENTKATTEQAAASREVTAAIRELGAKIERHNERR